MAGSQHESILDLLKDYILHQEVLQQIVEKLDSEWYSVRTLIEMSDDNLNRVISELFPEGSFAGVKMGFVTAIESRKKRKHADSTEGSSSTQLMEKMEKALKKNMESIDSMEKTFKRMREEAELDRKSKKSFSISGIKSADWDTLRQGEGYEWHDPEYTPTRLSDLPAFGWDDRQERAQAGWYMPYLNQIRRSQRWMMIDAANGHPRLLSGELNHHTIRGTSDVAVILRHGKTDPKSCVRCIFELKKEGTSQGVYQILVSLLMANMFSTQFRPFAVLTDLSDRWLLYWMDESRIYYTKFESRAVAVGTIEDLLGDEQDMSHSSRLPFLGSASLLFNRRMYVPPGHENMEELAGFIPDNEISSSRIEAGLRHAQMLQAQMLQADVVEDSGGFVSLRGGA